MNRRTRPDDPTSLERRARPTLLVAVLVCTTTLVFVVAAGAAAQRGPSTAQLDRGPASIVVTVLLTLAMIAGGAALFIVIAGFMAGGRRRGAEQGQTRRRSPWSVAALACAMVAGVLVLGAWLARRHSHLQASGGTPLATATHKSGPSLPFNATASLVTVAIVVTPLVALALFALAGSFGWRRRRAAELDDLAQGGEVGSDDGLVDAGDPVALAVAEIRVAPASEESDPRRAVVAAYLALLDAARAVGAERHPSETPTEFSARLLGVAGSSRRAARALTSLFELARYSSATITETDRTRAAHLLDEVRAKLASRAGELVAR